MKRIVFSWLVALVLWTLMFLPYIGLPVSFWVTMSTSALILTTLSLCLGGVPPLRFRLTELVWAVVIAAALWGVFWVGDRVSSWMFDFARPQVNLIYDLKDGQNMQWVALALLLIIGPAEELFWRGYLQRSLAARYTPDIAFAVTVAAYTLVHLPSLNFMLIMAALVCGLAWGLLYRFFPQHLTAIVVSHALWDAAAFVWFPF